MNIILSGGGTAGHINPAIAIAKYICLKDKNAKILFVGRKDGMENILVPREGFEIAHINVEGFKTSLSLKNIMPTTKFLAATVKSGRIISKFKADAVIGTGGYVCAPVVFAANLQNIPTIIHEQNVFPGSAIKFLSKNSSVTAISFDESRKYLKDAKNIVLTGNPIRPGILNANRSIARQSLGIKDQTFIVATGGSLGAKKINDVVAKYILKYARANEKILLSTGEGDYNRVKKMFVSKMPKCEFEIVPYIHNMETSLAAADLAINRAGAITLSELCALGVPSILVPSPNVVNNHQEYNAAAMEENGAAIMILEHDFKADVLDREIERLLNEKSLLEKMKKAAQKMAILNATEIIYKSLEEVIKK